MEGRGQQGEDLTPSMDEVKSLYYAADPSALWWASTLSRLSPGLMQPHGRAALPLASLCLPPRIIDYLVAHEVVHLRAAHHDADFWRRLERAMPDYAARKQWLAEHGGQF